MKRIAIIPARGGSKRIPNKNIKLFHGKPMISYVLKTARDSGLFDTIHVSTDDLKIQSVVESLGFPVEFSRPDSLADDHTPIMPVLKYVLEEYRARGQEFDQACLLMATAPLLEVSDIVAAHELFDSTDDGLPVIGVAEYPVPIEWAFERSDNGSLTPISPGKFSIRSQDLGKKYYDAGSFCFFSSQWVLATEGAGDDSSFKGYILPKTKAVDIDEDDDWAYAEAIYAHRHQAKGNTDLK